MKYRKKTIVIPYINENDNTFLLMVKDKMNKEWTFVTGGCKPNEPFNLCALRELFEETNGCLDLRNHVSIDINRFCNFRFKKMIKKDDVILDYKVYLIPMHRYGYDYKSFKKLEKKYNSFRFKYKEREFNETTSLKVFKIDDVYTMPDIWCMMKEYVLSNHNFECYTNDIMCKTSLMLKHNYSTK